MKREFGKIWAASRLMLLAYLPIVALLLGLLYAERNLGIPVSTFTRDPAAIANLPFYAGWVSSFGILLWAVSASIALFASWMSGGESRKYLASMGFLISILLIDDLFMMHEGLLPKFGVPEAAVFLAYAVAIILIIIKNAKFLSKQNYWMLLSAAFFLACGVLVDWKLGKYLPMEYLFEDGFKLLGIAGMFVHILDVSLRSVKKSR